MQEVEQFNGGWEFWLDERCGLELEQERAVFMPVPVPHDWMIWRDNLDEDGTGWYRKRVELTRRPGERVALFFEGVYMDTAVFVNGKLAGEWKYGYTSFHFDVTELLRDGENEILVRCAVKHPSSRWYDGAGIYRNVELWRYPEIHLEPWSLYVAPREQPDGSWKVLVQAEAPDGKGREAEFRMFDGKTLLDTQRVRLEADCFSGEFLVEQPRLWSLEERNLYRMEAVLLENGAETDCLESAFGFRSVELNPEKGLLLNHEPVKIHGMAMHHDLGCLGTAFSRCAARRQLELLKEMGANAIRTGHTVPAIGLMELADEMGLLVVDESFDCWTSCKTKYDYARFFAEWYRKDVASWVRRDRNHPSLLMWCIGNEIYDTHAGAQGMDTTRALLEEVRRHDPLGNGAVTLASNYMAWENTQHCTDILKLAGYNYGEKLYQEHHAAHPDWIIYGSETGSIVQSRGIYHFPLSKPLLVDDDLQCSSLGNSRTSWGAASIDACLNADQAYPFSLGQFVWSGFDYIGEPTPYHTKNSYFGQIDTAGFPKDAFYHYQAGWTDWRKKPVLHLFPYWDFNEGQLIDVCAVSNAPEVELWVNGVSQGRRKLPDNGSRCAVWQVPYHKGSLQATAYDGAGNVIARDEENSFGDGSALALHCERRSILADGLDLAFLTVTALDREGFEVKNANNRVTVTVSGSGQLLGLDNGDSADFEPYKTTCRRLFSGKLLAVVAGGNGDGAIVVEVSSPGLESAQLVLEAEPFAGEPVRHLPPLPPRTWEDSLSVRKIELTASGRELTPERPCIELTARVCPSDAYPYPLEWRLTDDGGVSVRNAILEVLDDRRVRITGLGDGAFRVRCCCANGGPAPQVISQLELSASGMGKIYPDPYQFLSGSLYTRSAGDVGNGNERGVSTSRSGQSWVAYENLDFGRSGADTVTIPIFELAGVPTPIRFWRGVPYAEGSRMIGERIYDMPTRWNVYQEATFHLDERLVGLDTFGIELQSKIHIKGFIFQRRSRAWDVFAAADRDIVYGDSYQESPEGILDIGNNVSLVFRELDFGAEGCHQITIRGRTKLENNSIHICFKGKDGETRRIAEFHRQEAWGEQSFQLEPVYGMQDVTFLFLPGSQFDFSEFQFRTEEEGK